MKKVPILVLAFNRADHVEQAMKAIQEYKPDRLYLECDGARSFKTGEDKAVEATRKKMLDMVDWPCEVKTLFREENLGCANAVYGAISWFFENEDYGIICEDDIVLSQDYFKLCEILLPRYKDKNKVMEISARNESYRKDIPNTYVYSQCYHCWGWATWKRAWEKMDMNMKAIDTRNVFYFVKRLGIIRGAMMYHYFKRGHKALPNFSSWATRWYLSILHHDGLVICPGVNLAINIGMDGGAHYEKGDEDPFAGLTLNQLQWPIVFNDSISADRKQTYYDNITFLKMRMMGMKKKLRRLRFW